MADPGWFWGAAADDLGLEWQHEPAAVMDVRDGIEWARWWVGGAFDYTSAALAPRVRNDPDGPALAWEGDDETIRR